MVGFIIFAVVILFVVIYNTPITEKASGGAYTPDPLTCTIPTTYSRREDFDSITKTNTDINSTTAMTTTKMQHVLKGRATDIIETKNLRKRSSKSKTSKKPKLRFSNNVKVRLFDKKTRDIIKDGKKHL